MAIVQNTFKWFSFVIAGSATYTDFMNNLVVALVKGKYPFHRDIYLYWWNLYFVHFASENLNERNTFTFGIDTVWGWPSSHHTVKRGALLVKTFLSTHITKLFKTLILRVLIITIYGEKICRNYIFSRWEPLLLNVIAGSATYTDFTNNLIVALVKGKYPFRSDITFY